MAAALKALACIFIFVPPAAAADPIGRSEIKFTDGDTIRARAESYRLVGFDTPETWSRRRIVSPAERTLGKRARQRARQLVAAGDLDLIEVPCACTKHTRRDNEGRCRTNGRLCAVLKVNGTNIGSILIEEGLVREYICTATECPKQLPWD